MDPEKIRITVSAEHVREIRNMIRMIERGEYPRPEIMEFAVAMETKLQLKDDKYGNSWQEMTPGWLYRRLLGEIRELRDAAEGVTGPQFTDDHVVNPVGVKAECVDVSNVSMMLYHRVHIMQQEATE